MADTKWMHEIMGAMAAGDGDACAAYFAEDGYIEDVGRGDRFEGRKAISDWLSKTPEFISDADFEVESSMSDGERFAMQWRFTGTWISNGKTFDNRGASLGELRDGLIVAWSDYTNPAQLHT